MAKMKSGDIASDRAADEIREIDVTLDFTPNADASVLYRQGDTMVLACATVASSLPRWFPRDADRGWVHAEYSLLPGSTDSRFQRERRGAKGRTQEIERLVEEGFDCRPAAIFILAGTRPVRGCKNAESTGLTSAHRLLTTALR